jgi:hypothetical protein
MAEAGIKINRIKAKNKANLSVLSDILKPEVLHARVPRLADVAEARVMHRNKMNEIQQWGDHTRASGFTPDKNLQYVAQIDQAVWSVIVDTFARTDPETGKYMDDGLLFKTDFRGNIVLNRDFFYAVIETLQDAGYECDMRGKIKLT